MLIRRERPADVPAIRSVHVSAFAGAAGDGEPAEAGLVDLLRSDAGAWIAPLSLVAEVDGQVVGHVVCSRARLDGVVPVLGLGPLGVTRAHQGRGVGSTLVHAVCAAAEALDEHLVVLLGAPGYYGRFGFVPAAQLDVAPPVPSWAPHFQVRPLAAYDAGRDVGRFTYAAAFDGL